jgi:hypothetical protein
MYNPERFDYFPYSEKKNKVAFGDNHAVCAYVYPPPPKKNFLMAEPIFMKHGIHIMAPEPI